MVPLEQAVQEFDSRFLSENVYFYYNLGIPYPAVLPTSLYLSIAEVGKKRVEGSLLTSSISYNYFTELRFSPEGDKLSIAYNSRDEQNVIRHFTFGKSDLQPFPTFLETFNEEQLEAISKLTGFPMLGFVDLRKFLGQLKLLLPDFRTLTEEESRKKRQEVLRLIA